MSPHKRKLTAPGPSDLQDAFDAINDIIIRVKTKLTDASDTARSSLVTDLHRLAALSQSFTEQRPRSNRNWIDLADALDREGVHLWNASALIRQNSGTNDLQLYAALRLAGFRLIEAGLEQRPSVQTLIHVLQLASKTGAVLSELGNNNAAASVLGCAAKFEELLRNVEDDQSDGIQDASKARAVVLYYSCRMQAAWREGNDAIAQFMLEKATESDEKQLSLIPPYDRELLAVRILEIGKSFLKNPKSGIHGKDTGNIEPKKAEEAVKWLQKAFTLVEKMEDTSTPGIMTLRRTILQCLARAYFLSSPLDAENLLRAETTLQELIQAADTSSDKALPELQQLRWMRLAVLKRQKAPDPILQQAFESIADHSSYTESDVSDILQELRTFTQHALVAAVLQRCLQGSLGHPEIGIGVVDRLLLSVVFHAAKDQDHKRAMKDVETAFNMLVKAEFELDQVPSMACLTALWQYGDRLYQAKKWQPAADWFLSGTHRLFESISDSCKDKCLRKAALCLIEQSEYTRAATVIRCCSLNQATTCYVLFLTAAYQGLEDEAIKAVENMGKAPDFDRRMLLLATQLSHEVDLKTLLLHCLEALLKTMKARDSPEPENNALVLIRCIIRLELDMLKKPCDEQHYHAAQSILDAALKNKNTVMISKDVSWLWRTAYNTAVQGCSEWQHAEDQVADLFEIAHDLLRSYSTTVVANADAEIFLHIVYSLFAAVSGRVFVLRRLPPNNTQDRDRLQLRILDNIGELKNSIASCKAKQAQIEPDQLRRFLHIARVFETEIYSQRGAWACIPQIVQGAGSGSESLKTCEAIADILWGDENCPSDVLYVVLEAILHGTLERGTLSVEKFSRWLRAICSILLAHNSVNDRNKAVTYIEQAVGVLRMHHESEREDYRYPLDERQWLLATSYNTGIECLSATSLDEAKRWFESATVICCYVPNGKQLSEKISESYRVLLEQYS